MCGFASSWIAGINIMSALTKAQMAEKLFEELGLNKREAKEVVELFFEEVRHP